MDSDVFTQFMNFLTNKNNICSLELSDNKNLSDEEAIILTYGLKNNTILKSLQIDHSQIGDIGFQALLSSLPNSLPKLNIDDSLVTGKSLLTFIKTHLNLKHVSLKENGISSSSSTEINVPDLQENILKIANAKHCRCDFDINKIVQQKVANLKNDEISLADGKLRDDHVLELCNELKKQSNRNWSLDLSRNQRISSVGYRHLADILSSAITIVKLSFSDNYMTNEARATLLKGLCNNKTVEKFVMINEKLINQDMEYIGRFVQNNTALKEIVLNKCEIDDDGLAHLIKVLPESTLEKLELNDNSIGDPGFASLLSSIPSTLITLLLDRNKITKASLQPVVTFLAANRTLKKLIIVYNPIFEYRHWGLWNNECWLAMYGAAEQNKICKLDEERHF